MSEEAYACGDKGSAHEDGAEDAPEEGFGLVGGLDFEEAEEEEKEEEIPEWLKSKKNEEQGGKGKRHKGEEGKMGKKTSKNKEGLYGLKGPKDNPDPHLAKKLAEEQAKNAGILGVLKMNEGSHIASIFGRDTALGTDAEDVLGGLIGNQIGEAYGVGGLGLDPLDPAELAHRAQDRAADRHRRETQR